MRGFSLLPTDLVFGCDGWVRGELVRRGGWFDGGGVAGGAGAGAGGAGGGDVGRGGGNVGLFV